MIDQLDEIERGKGSGTLQLPDGQTLAVTNLRKIFWPTSKLTKGDLMRYYVRVAPFILPVVNDRPLIMKRLPNGVEGPSFYQHRAPDHVPAGVRLVSIDGDDVPSRIVGGTLLTLLYMTQLAAISQDPWFSRAQSPHMASHCAIDLDPMPGVTFESVLDVARWVRDELVKLNVTGYPKTSGASGVHIYVPLRRRHAVRGWPDLLPDSGDLRGREASEGGDRHTRGPRPRPESVCGLPAEYRRQVARLRVQRTRQRLCRRVNAVDLGRNR